LKAYLLPFGAPGDGPPCIRHLPFGIDGDWHGVPLRVLAPQRFARRICDCMGLTLLFRSYPAPGPLHVADNGLPAFVDVDVLHRDFLLAFAAVAVERFQERGE
jgi:hypothetical protein